MGRLALLVLLGVIGAIAAYFAPMFGLVLLALVVVSGIALVKSGAALTGLASRLTVLVPAIAAVGVGLLWTMLHFGLAGARTPAPPASISCTPDTSQRKAVLAYARTLQFAEYIDSTDVYPTDTLGEYQRGPDPYHGHGGKYHGQWDKDLVDTLGDVVILEPEVNIHRSRASDLRCGRIQMRMRLRVGQKGREPMQIYESLRVPPGVSYLWVDSLQLTNSDSGTARGVIFPVDPGLPARIEKVRVYRNGSTIWNRAVARWTPAKCWSCPASYWCSDGPHS